LSDFRRGWGLFREQKKVDRATWLKGLSDFYIRVKNYDAEAIGLVAAEIAAAHSRWLNAQNQKLRVA